jgi:uncharacterized protein (DUF1015 family)
MATVIPFCGIRYNPEKIDDLALVMAPPYDVISAEEQESYYKTHPHNIIRLILGRTFPADTEDNNRYTRAGTDFSTWRKQAILKRDPEPSFYFYRQEFSLNDGSRAVRDGFIGLVKLEDFEKGTIIPHEKTLSKPKEDRLQLMRACQANFSCIFSLYQDPEERVNKLLQESISAGPYLDMTDKEGCRHMLWRVVAHNITQRIGEVLHNSKIFIADGHHRYETALGYSKEMRKKCPEAGPDAPFNYIMMYLTPMESDGLIIYPYHRAMHNLGSFESALFEEKLQACCRLEKLSYPGGSKDLIQKAFEKKLQEQGQKGPSFGVIVKGLSHLLVASINEDVLPKDPSTVEALDVSILERCLFNDILGIDSISLREQQNIVYFHHSKEGFSLVEDHGYQIAIILNPTKIEELKSVASTGDKMPQKSTYFYPKVLSGPVINSIAAEEII